MIIKPYPAFALKGGIWFYVYGAGFTPTGINFESFRA